VDINRVIAAVQRTSHLKDKQMGQQYSELYEIAFNAKLEQIGLDTSQYVRSAIACVLSEKDKGMMMMRK
jgi:hypothetical protein